jgi:hypothetical protein
MPETDSETVKAEQEKERKIRQLATGRDKTNITRNMLEEEEAPVKRTTLGG